MSSYITKNDTIIFSPLFNKKLDHQLLKNFKKIIFSNFHLHLELFEKYENNNFDNVYLIETHTVNSTFNKSVIVLSSCSSITHLIFGCCFNHPVNNLPSSITHLTLGHAFNQPVNNLPSSITHLTFAWSFNQPIDMLPSSITHLTFGWSFNQPIDMLPSSITHLTFGANFDQPIDMLP